MVDVTYSRYRHTSCLRRELRLGGEGKGEPTRRRFGDPANTLCDQKDKEFQLLEKGAMLGIVTAEFPTVVSVLRRIPVAPFTVFDNVIKAVQDFGHQAVKSVNTSNVATRSIFTTIAQDQKSKTGTISGISVQSEASGLIVAGSGTTAITLTYLIWVVLQHPSVQRHIQDEVCSLETDYTDQDIENLPWTCAAIEEALRLYGAAPGSLPRVVPQTGAELAGYHVPAGTIVTTQAFTNHRDGDVFAEPER